MAGERWTHAETRRTETRRAYSASILTTLRGSAALRAKIPLAQGHRPKQGHERRTGTMGEAPQRARFLAGDFFLAPPLDALTVLDAVLDFAVLDFAVDVFVDLALAMAVPPAEADFPLARKARSQPSEYFCVAPILKMVMAISLCRVPIFGMRNARRLTMTGTSELLTKRLRTVNGHPQSSDACGACDSFLG